MRFWMRFLILNKVLAQDLIEILILEQSHWDSYWKKQNFSVRVAMLCYMQVQCYAMRFYATMQCYAAMQCSATMWCYAACKCSVMMQCNVMLQCNVLLHASAMLCWNSILCYNAMLCCNAILCYATSAMLCCTCNFIHFRRVNIPLYFSTWGLSLCWWRWLL